MQDVSEIEYGNLAERLWSEKVMRLELHASVRALVMWGACDDVREILNDIAEVRIGCSSGNGA